MKVLIINYNRLTLPVMLAEWVAARGCEPIFIDNASTYEPLAEYYHNSPFLTMHLNRNYGHLAPWLPETSVLKRLGLERERYIVTDPDLDLTGVPDNFVAAMGAGLDMYRKYDKCGLSLEINDLPDTPEGQFIRGVEAVYWTKPLGSMYYDAPTDTTFAMYREGVTKPTHSAIRIGRPYTAKHVPWHYYHIRELPPDEQYYYETAGKSASGKPRLIW